MYIHNNLHDQLNYNFHYSLQMYTNHWNSYFTTILFLQVNHIIVNHVITLQSTCSVIVNWSFEIIQWYTIPLFNAY